MPQASINVSESSVTLSLLHVTRRTRYRNNSYYFILVPKLIYTTVFIPVRSIKR